MHGERGNVRLYQVVDSDRIGQKQGLVVSGDLKMSGKTVSRIMSIYKFLIIIFVCEEWFHLYRSRNGIKSFENYAITQIIYRKL